MNFITNSAVIVKPRSLSCLKAILEAIMPCLPTLWPLVPDGWLVWELWLTLKWEGKLILKSSTENEAGTVTDCACTPCCLQWSLCNGLCAMVNAQDGSKCILQTEWGVVLLQLPGETLSVGTLALIPHLPSKAALYNSVEVMPVWKRCKRTFWFVQRSMAISPLKKIGFEPTSKVVNLLCGYSFENVEGRHHLFTVCMLCSALNGSILFLFAVFFFFFLEHAVLQSDSVLQPRLAAFTPYWVKTLL